MHCEGHKLDTTAVPLKMCVGVGVFSTHGTACVGLGGFFLFLLFFSYNFLIQFQGVTASKYIQ